MRQMWEAQATSRGQQASSSVPPNVAPIKLAVFTNPFPQEGYVAALLIQVVIDGNKLNE